MKVYNIGAANVCRSFHFCVFFMDLRELSRHTGYSVSVLSRALNPRPDASSNVSAATREKIRKLVRELGFRPNRLASCVRRGKIPSIGIFLPTYSGSLIADAVFGISAAAAERKLPLNFYFGERDDFQSFLQHMCDEGCTGIIAGSNVLPGDSLECLALIERFFDDGGKLVFFNEQPLPSPRVRKLPAYSVLAYDDVAGGRLAAEHLCSLNCRSLLLVEPGDSQCFLDRHKGFLDYCQEKGMDSQIIPETRVLRTSRKLKPEFFELLFETMQSRPKGAIGLFVPSDYLLLDIMVHISGSKWRMGRDIHLVGYNFNDFSACISGWPFATLQQDFVREGQMAIKMLAELMDGKAGGKILLQPLLKICNIQYNSGG